MNFPHEAHHSLLFCSETLASASALHLKTFKQQSHQQKKHKNAKDMTLNRRKSTLSDNMQVQIRRQYDISFDFNWKCEHGWLKFFLLCAWLQMTTKAMVSIDFEVTNKYWPVGEFTNTESANNEHWLYIN